MRIKSLCAIALSLVFAVPASPALAQDISFDAYLQLLIARARAEGVSEGTIRRMTDGLDANPRVIELDRSQPGTPTRTGYPPLAPYIATHVDRARVQRGREMYAATRGMHRQLEQRFGVPPEILLAIWGHETNYGGYKGNFDLARSLATLAWEGRRRELFATEFVDLLKVADKGYSRSQLVGSWAGAFGNPQFLPSVYLRLATDGDGDGRADIFNNRADTLASIANYLDHFGWVKGRDWGFEVTVPDTISCALEGPDRGRRIADWEAMGIRRVGGKSFPAHELRGEGFLMMPAGRSGPAFIVTPNFYVLKEYNESDLYALFVGHAGDRIMYGDSRFQAGWGKVDSMYRSDIAAMQRVLEGKGYDVGGADGLPGFRTRRSIGDWQAKNGRSPTCFPDNGLLKAVR